MRVSINGSEGTALCQIGALREGFAALGHEHTFEQTHPDTAFVFVGNAPYDDYLNLARSRVKKTIFNVLDLCPHCPDHTGIVSRLREQLPLADKVTAISKTVADELLVKCGIKADVIYYPMKNVRHTGLRKYPQFRAMLCGRLADPNKRTNLAGLALLRAGFNESEAAMVGPERVPWGTMMGIVSDEGLNDLYNSVDYVLMTSANEGIGLTAIEAAICGAVPIVLPTLSTFDEFWAESPLGLHYQQLNSPNDIAKLILSLEDNPTWKAEVKQDMMAYASLAFRPKFDRKAVASRVLDVFHSI